MLDREREIQGEKKEEAGGQNEGEEEVMEVFAKGIQE